MSIKNISRLILQKDFISLSPQFQLKILISETLVRYKLHQIDVIEEKIRTIQKNYKSTLKKNSRDNNIILIISSIIHCENINKNKNLMSIIKGFLSESSKELAENTDVINYNEWLEGLI